MLNDNEEQLLKLKNKSGSYYDKIRELAELLAKDYQIRIVDLYGVSISVQSSSEDVFFVYNTHRGVIKIYKVSGSEYVKLDTTISLDFNSSVSELYSCLIDLDGRGW